MYLIAKILFLSLIFTSASVQGQTYVSGPIISDVIWTYANSPYIVTDSIAVFPGVTLTIEPGVEVKFEDSTNMLVRGYLNAAGNQDSTILFTSTSISPQRGIWNGVQIKSDSLILHFIKIEYAQTAFVNEATFCKIYDSQFSNNEIGISQIGTSSSFDFDTNYVENCLFDHNNVAISSCDNYSRIKDCEFLSNSIGINYVHASLILNNTFSFNTDKAINGFGADYIGNIFTDNNIGMYIKLYHSNTIIRNNFISGNQIGLSARGSDTSTPNTGFYNNTICDNGLYNVQNTDVLDLDLTNNCWCTTDSVLIMNSIYDAYDNVGLGIIYFSPFKENCTDGVIDELQADEINMFPNPVSIELTITDDQFEIDELSIYNSYGNCMLSKRVFIKSHSKSVTIDIADLSPGIYLVKVDTEKGNIIKKFIKQ